MATYIMLANSGGELASVKLADRDATGEAIARAAIELIEQTGSLHDGDTIKIVED